MRPATRAPGPVGSGRRGRGSSGPAGSAREPPSSSDWPGGSLLLVAGSFRNGIHSIRPAIGNLINPSSTINVHSGMSQTMLLLPDAG